MPPAVQQRCESQGAADRFLHRPRRSSRLHARTAWRSAVAGVLAQLRVRADLALRDREALLECGERALARRVGIVGLEAGGPVAGLPRVAAYQVEPALRLERELPGALHVDGVANG